METFEYDIDPACEKMRLDLFLTRVQDEITRSYLKKLIEDDHVTVNDQPAKASYRLKLEDRVELKLPDPAPLEVQAEAIPLNVVFEDEHLIVVDKPAGLVVHPAPGHASGTLVNALLHHCKDLKGIGGVERPGIVHRLDKDTSGLIVVAKTEKALQSLAGQFKDRTVTKVYLALAKGTMEKTRGVIDSPIGRHKVHRKKMSSHTHKGREAETRYEVVTQFDKYALVRLFPKTGRTHQLRVHLASIGHPILGDGLYGGTSGPGVPKISRQALHAHSLKFIHPETGEELHFESPLPEDMQALIA
jgi:23S rRNA pseudouridine1911/1915/1917 synthase